MNLTLTTKVSLAGGLFKRYAPLFEKLGILTLEDFLYHVPTRYEDFSLIAPINTLQEGEVVTVIGEIKEIKNSHISRFKTIQRAVVTDDTGEIAITWFNQPFIIKNLSVGDKVALSGRVVFFAKKLSLQVPEYELIKEDLPLIHTGRLVPVYKETRGISSKNLRKQIYSLLELLSLELEDYLPEDIRSKYHFYTLLESFKRIHFPVSFEEAQEARTRLEFDELFFLKLKAIERKNTWEKEQKRKAFSIEKHAQTYESFLKSLPFSLTGTQNEAIKDIFSDLRSEKAMNRLLQGDVGSGKTIVAATAMFMTHLNGFQSVLMAPTEILAEQHYTSISKLLAPFNVRVGLVTGSKKLIQKLEARSSKSEDRTPNSELLAPNIVIGTHAVLSEKVVFENLGLVVIDEQQRFGVEQRGIIRQKGDNPHLLTMTATPIPRTIALSMYGDLDLSYLNEMPKGRKAIKTWLVPPTKRDGAYNWIRTELTTHDSQAFIICPFIEESENMQTIKAAKSEFERLQKEVFPDLRLALLHGKQKAKEKDEILEEFRAKKYDILVATPVVEVGIDIPNATIIMIEASERFGLSQLHQLRGRVGRGDKQSYCLLFTESKNGITLERLKALEHISIGAELSELDLRLRGAGDMYGTIQHGRANLRIANFSNPTLIKQAQSEAERLFPHLLEFPLLMKKFQTQASSEVSPD